MKSLCILALLVSAAARAADFVVIVGAGQSGTWDTQIELANPTDALLGVQLSNVASTNETACPGPCPWTGVTIPAHGTTTVLVSNIPTPATGLNTIYVVVPDGFPLPTVRARERNLANPRQAVELVPVRFSTLLAANPQVLVFPSLIRNADVHSNLGIGSFFNTGELPVTVRVEAYSSDGTLLGSGVFSNCPTAGVPCQNLFLVDVAHQLGIESVEDGQLRVTKLTGIGLFWGELANVYPAGNVSISVGQNP